MLKKIVFASLLFSANSALAADGAALYTSKLCATCHGPAGQKPTSPIYPSLAGKDASCLEEQFLKIQKVKEKVWL